MLNGIYDIHSKPVLDLKFNHSNTLLATSSEDFSVKILNLNENFKAFKGIVGFKSDVVCLIWNPLNEFQIFCSSDTTIYLFDIKNDKLVLNVNDAIRSWNNFTDFEINKIDINSKGNSLIWCDDNGTLGSINLTNDKVNLFKLRHSNISSVIQFRPNRINEILSGSYDSSALIWDSNKRSIIDTLDLNTKRSNNQLPMSSPPFVLSIATTVDGRHLAVGSANGSIWLSFAKNDKHNKKFSNLSSAIEVSQSHNGPVVSLSFNSKYLVSCSLHQLKLWFIEDLANDNFNPIETINVNELEKTNAVLATDTSIFIGGFSSTGKGRLVVKSLM